MGAQNSKSVYEFTVKDAKGKDVELSQYKGKVLLIVNVASNCGYSDTNYTEMNQLYEKYKDQGFEILAFPCNQFGAQEPGTDAEIQELACTRFKAEYTVFAKINVKGPNQAPLYRSLKSSSTKLFRGSIKWNFTKFLIDQEGNVVGRYKPETTPLTFEDDIKKLIDVAAAQTDEQISE